MNLRRMSWKKRIGVGAGAGFLLLVALFGIGYVLTDVPAPNAIATAQSTRVLFADGRQLGRIGKNRSIVPLSQVSKNAQHAVLAAEDREFYSEPGVSPKGLVRALFSNVQAGGVSQGGSTITQQYAKNAFLTQERTYTRKIKEVFIALKMSQTVSKDTILEDYLNTIYFGRGAYGIEAASETYFHGTKAKDLTVAQSAVLASSIRSPAGYDPAKHPKKAKERWAYVLDGMVKQQWLSPTDRDKAVFPAVTGPVASKNFPGSLDYVRQHVIADLEKHGFDEARITAGGLTVRTTLHRHAQEAAVKAVEDLIPAQKAKDDPVSSLVAIEPGTGKVIAYYGGREPGGFDYASDGKGVQPGSSMKPYTLAAALQKGTSVDSTFDGSSPQTICGSKIRNDAGDPPLGQTDLATGLQFSVNTVYYRLACNTGPRRIADLAHAAGIPDSQLLSDQTSHKPTAQITLGAGGYEIHVLDQAAGYASFAAKGTRATPYFVQSVTDSDGNELYSAKPKTGHAFSQGVAADATYAMQKVVQAGTGTQAQLANGRPTAGKTGTTSKNANAWFAGFTPQLATAVWVGRPSGAPLKGVLGSANGVYGGTIPAKIFKAFMDKALEGAAVLPFPPKAGVGKTIGTPAPTPSATPSATLTPSPTPTPSAAVTQPPVPTSTRPSPSSTRLVRPPRASKGPPAASP